jgi:hypothetical protein
MLKPDFNKIRAQRERLAYRRKIEEHEAIIANFKAKHYKPTKPTTTPAGEGAS